MFKEDKEYKFNPKEIRVFEPKTDWMSRMRLNEDNNVLDPNIIPNFPINKPVKFDQSLMVKAIEYGLVILINYRGDKDKWRGGRERTIQPLVLGINKNTKNMLVRGWHLEGWSVSQKKETKKVWRLFKTDNIMTMTFTGNFFRLPPKGYKMNDRLMTERTIIRADFNRIRMNQNKLLQAGKIQDEEETTLGQKSSTMVPRIEVTNTNTKIDLKVPWENEIMDQKQAANTKISILRSIFGREYIAVVGALGTVGKTVKVFENDVLKGNYKTIKSFIGSDFNKNRIIEGQNVFDLYVFNKKL